MPVTVRRDFPDANRRLDAAIRDPFRKTSDEGPNERLRVGDDLGQEALISPEGVFGPAEPPNVDLESTAMEWRDVREVARMRSLVHERLGRLGVVPSQAD